MCACVCVAFDAAVQFDDQIERKLVLAPGQLVDPKTCLFFPLRVRKDFRDHEKQRNQHLEKIAKAMGVPIAFEADYPALYSDDKLSKDYKFRLGYNL